MTKSGKDGSPTPAPNTQFDPSRYDSQPGYQKILVMFLKPYFYFQKVYIIQ